MTKAWRRRNGRFVSVQERAESEVPLPLRPEQAGETAKTIAERFGVFHADNPGVYRELVRLARQARRAHPGCKLGIAMLFEVVRWRVFIRTKEDDGFKLNNNHRSFFARLIMASEKDLSDVFETRKLHDEE